MHVAVTYVVREGRRGQQSGPAGCRMPDVSHCLAHTVASKARLRDRKVASKRHSRWVSQEVQGSWVLAAERIDREAG